MPRGSLLLALVALSLGLAGCKPGGSAEERRALKVAAAASLSDAFEELGRAFEASTGQEVDFTFTASGKIARQLAQGAPFDVFASANMAYVDEVIAEGAGLADARSVFAVGRLAVWVPEGAPPARLADLAEPRFERVGIANPEHAPYGVAAKDALAASGVLDDIQGRLAFGSSVHQALQFAETGNADAALVALSLVVDDERTTLVDRSLHRPLEYGATVASASPQKQRARAFVEFLTSEKGRAVLARYGLEAP